MSTHIAQCKHEQKEVAGGFKLSNPSPNASSTKATLPKLPPSSIENWGPSAQLSNQKRDIFHLNPHRSDRWHFEEGREVCALGIQDLASDSGLTV